MKIGHSNCSTVTRLISDLPKVNDVSMEVAEEDEEDEDVDFNPFMRDDTHSEASSSLSSENEAPADGDERISRSYVDGVDASVSSIHSEERKGCERDDIMMQTTVHEGDDLLRIPMEKELTPIGEAPTCSERSTKGLSPRNGSDAVPCLTRNGTTQRSILEIDNEDAICRRTRARHSLANYTLEELETFLQESDDDGDPPNVDDEEEYHKFLAAVLVEGLDGGSDDRDDNVDEDEENDADFVLEIEEALESDSDEIVDCRRGQSGKQDGDVHMPVTRQKKRMKESMKSKKTLSGQAKMPLQPLIPYESIAQITAFIKSGWQFQSPKELLHCSTSFSGAQTATVFTSHQIGQLYCLIHEHVQFLIQVFSVSILDPSKQEVASEIHEMLTEMIYRREEALERRNVPYPGYCFHPPNLHSSRQLGSEQAANYSHWTPLIDIPVLSILDVAPLRLAKSFISDVSDTVTRYRQSHVEAVTMKGDFTREPLFPLPILESFADTNKDASRGTQIMCSNTRIDGSKQESVALVPKGIARSVERFYHLFNGALFPHKPPPPSIANRVLFTDAEDRLLAMGLMEYNNDWAAIQKRFLPCKTEHQIFVRQKNRAASRIPENPIKAVRRIKNSPLTAHEIACIYEGLKLFKNDWLSVWKFIVPHRDPSLLPRQWRLANGMQKSYKKSEDVKEKRRLYDRKRKSIKASTDGCHTSSEVEQVDNKDNNTGDIDGEDEAYVHEAFLAESQHQSSSTLFHDVSLPSLNRNEMQPINTTPCIGSSTVGSSDFLANGSREPQKESGCGLQNSSFQSICLPAHFSHGRHIASLKDPSSNLVSRASTSHIVSRHCQTPKKKGARIVKLAPDLPPVNLPPSVRIFSQPSVEKFHSEPSSSKSVDTAKKSHAPIFCQAVNIGCNVLDRGDHLNKYSNNVVDAGCLEDGATCTSQFGDEDNTSHSDLQMHPLLFQAHENKLPSYLTNSFHSIRPGIYNFFPGDQFQTDLSLLRRHLPVRPGACSSETQDPDKAQSDLCTVEFHPLLQRVDNGTDSFVTPSLYRLSEGLEAAQDNCSKFNSQFDCAQRISLVPTSGAPLSHDEKQNNLDLDIRLSSAPENGETSGREINEHHDEGAEPGLEHIMLEKYQHAGATSANCSELPPSNNGACQCMEGLHDDSMAGIVMEQEELSDSEEDIEQVEFECEEIDDSEGDEMDDEQLSGVQNKEFSFLTSKEEEIQASRTLPTRHPKRGSAAKGKNCSAQASQNVCNAERLCVKPKSGCSKRNKSCKNPRDGTQPQHRQSRQKQSSDKSKVISSQTIQCNGAAAASRKPRK